MGLKMMILRWFVLKKGATKFEMYGRLNDYANFTSKYLRSFYLHYCENLSVILNEIRRLAK